MLPLLALSFQMFKAMLPKLKLMLHSAKLISFDRAFKSRIDIMLTIWVSVFI